MVRKVHSPFRGSDDTHRQARPDQWEQQAKLPLREWHHLVESQRQVGDGTHRILLAHERVGRRDCDVADPGGVDHVAEIQDPGEPPGHLMPGLRDAHQHVVVVRVPVHEPRRE